MVDPAANSADELVPAGTGFLIRPLTADDWPDAKAIDAAAFGYEPNSEFLDTVSLPAQDIRRFTGVFDPALDGILVGIGGIQSRKLTFPGRGPSSVAAVTWVGVRPDQQRRGILREVMTAQLTGLHDQQAEPVAILTASEAGIYGRFGYGLATWCARMELPAPTPLRPGTATEPVREMPKSQALPLIKHLHGAVAPTFPGFLDRSPQVWAALFSDHPFAVGGRGPRRYVVHRDGYAVFRLAEGWTDRGPDHTLTIVEFCAATPVATTSLWRHLLAYPLVRKVVFPRAWVDEPLPHLLADPRAISTGLRDEVWLRLVDLPRAVPLRTYRTSVTIVARIFDAFCPWNDGTWQLALTTAGGTATESGAPAAIALDISALGAAFLGGTRIARLAAAGRVTGDADAIDALDRALAGALAPWTPEGF